jgi:arylsulfatase A-like enzyme/Tfp pilus assembly protein PilF
MSPQANTHRQRQSKRGRDRRPNPPPWRRWVIVLGIVIAGAAFWLAVQPSRLLERQRVNILLITIDTLRWDRVGAYGYKNAATPALDALAARGARFETAVAHAALTAPSHASMLTGLNPPRHGVRDNGAFVLPAGIPSLAGEFARAGYDTAGFVSGFPLDRRFGFAAGFGVFDDRLPRGETSGSRMYVERRADDTTTRVLAWLDGRAGAVARGAASPPWLLWVHYFDPHAAYEPPPEFAERFKDSPYDGEIAFVDAQLARLFQHLEGSGALSRTIVVATADHGESLGEHGEQTHGIFVYDATLRIPFIVAGPGVSAGITPKVVARGVDVMPTLMELGGLGIPGGLDGRSLGPALKGTAMPDEPAYIEGLVAARHLGWAALHGLRSSAWKFIDAPRAELYDLSADASEQSNAIAAHGDRADALRSALQVTMQAPPAAGTSAAPDAETTARLRALGYLSGRGTTPAPGNQASGPALRDPKDGISLINTLETGVSLATSDPARAIALLRSVLAEDPGIELARRHLAIAFSRSGQHREAIDLLQALRTQKAATAEDLSLLSESLRVTGRESEGRAVLAEAAALDPRSPDPPLTLARALLSGQQFGEAAAEYRRALEIAPDHPEALAGLGETALARGDVNDAAHWFERTLARDPQDRRARLRLAVVRARQGRTADALPLFQMVVQADPANADALAGLAAALAKSGRPAEAIPYFERALQAGLPSPAVLNGLGLARLESGDRSGALAAFRTSLKARADQPEISRLVRDLSARQSP